MRAPALVKRGDVAFQVGRAVELAGVRAGAGFRVGRHFRQLVVVFRVGRATVIVMMRMLVWCSMLERLQRMAA